MFITNGWYCAAFASEMGAPFARRILGQPVLLVRDASGAPHAMGDRCPHRFAPLHKGSVIDDRIECPYHGLQFGMDGRCVHNPHGDGRIPGAAKVPVYPVVERDGLIWIWMGHPEAADPSSLPDLHLIDRSSRPIVGGHIMMDVDYRLVLDNLTDLSHAAYIHAGTLSPSRAKRESTNEATSHSVAVHTVMRGVPTPSSQALYFDQPVGDYHSDIEWIAPGIVRQQLAMTACGEDADAGAVTRNVHLITPATATSTHYFWMHTRNRLMDDRSIDEQTVAIITNAFTTEDEPMMAACQDYMGGKAFFSLKPLYLATDFAGTRCRRIVEGLIAAENGEGGHADADAMTDEIA
ncbi:aromatic ring-hydroxylating dioxygenase subunit alpha [Sphingobium ummariense]|uniref:Rieske domain-containing protein n=1 Tax=Sphingobium ummariense RL-3 TaxID=1346791 RepID=T0IYB7_9SPHN|nr:aromatic ring-hydroxylating dioxygenase subunit alpha [Sphingobium ummariense]EQB30736.1 hypothetical protein M529_18505 [Sphingobium ummariense RL-3]